MSAAESLRVPRRLLCLGFILSVSLVSAGCGDAHVTAEQHLQRAEQLRSSGDLAAAVVEFKIALEKYPDNADLRFQLGRTYLDTGNGAAAEKELSKASSLGMSKASLAVPLARAALMQGNAQQLVDEEVQETIDGRDTLQSLTGSARADLLALRGHAFLATGNADFADKLYDQSLSVDGGNTEAQLGKAEVLRARRRPDEARRRVDLVLKREPESASAWSILGDIERDAGRLKEAEQAYGKAIRNRVTNTGDRINRALTRIALEDYKGAKEDAAIFNKVAPNNPKAMFVRGLLSYAERDYESAQEAFESALSRAPNYMAAAYQLGITHYHRGQSEQAEQYLRRYLAAYPDSDRANRALAKARLLRGDLEGAEAVLKHVLKRNPNDPVSLNLMAKVALPQGKVEDAIAYLEQMAADKENAARAHLNLGLVYLSEGRSAQASKAWHTAQSLDPESQNAVQLLVYGHINARELDKAIEVAEQNLRDWPDHPQAANLLGAARVAKQDYARAREAFERALRLQPDYPAAAYNLAKVAIHEGKIEEARSLLKGLLDRSPSDLRVMVALAELEARAGNNTASLDLLHTALREHPTALRPRLILANYYLASNQTAKALEVIQGGMSVHGENPELLKRLASAQYRSGQRFQAADTAEKLARIQPGSVDAHYLLARIHADDNDRAAMQQELRRVLATDPNHVSALLMLMASLTDEGKYDEATQKLAQLKRLDGQDPRVFAAEGELALRQGRGQDAVAAYTSALERTPNNVWTTRLARAQWQTGNRNGAVATLDGWLDTHPSDVLVRHALANVYLLQQQPDAAKAQFVKILESSPGDVTALNNLAGLMQRSSAAEALRYAEKARDLAPDNPMVLDTLAMILLDLGENERSIALLRTAVEKGPDLPVVRYHLAVALARSGDQGVARETLRQLLDSAEAFPQREKAQDLLKELGG